MIKKFYFLLLGIIIGGLLSFTLAFADEQATNQIKIVLKGVEIPEANALIIDGTTYIPVRKLCEALNYDVTYNAETQTVKISQKIIENNTIDIPGAIKNATKVKITIPSPPIDQTNTGNTVNNSRPTIIAPTNTTTQNSTGGNNTVTEKVKTKSELRAEKIAEMIKNIPTGSYLVEDEEIPVYRPIPAGYHIYDNRYPVTQGNIVPDTPKVQQDNSNQTQQ